MYLNYFMSLNLPLVQISSFSMLKNLFYTEYSFVFASVLLVWVYQLDDRIWPSYQSTLSCDEDTVVFSTDFDNFYPSFDAPVVAEMAVQELLRSGLNNRELRLYVSICYKREDLEAWASAMWPTTNTRVWTWWHCRWQSWGWKVSRAEGGGALPEEQKDAQSDN